MKIRDLFSLAIRNLWRRKLRTFLTVIGVFIGCMSIIVMTSLGLAQKKSQDELLNANAGLVTIRVNPTNYYDPAMGSKPPSKGIITDATIKELKNLNGVKNIVVTNRLNGSNTKINIGKYETYGQVGGLEEGVLEDVGVEISEGRYPTKGLKEVEVLVADDLSNQVYDPKDHGMGPPKQLKVDLKKDKIKLTIGNIFVEKNPATAMLDGGEESSTKTEKIKIKISGTFKKSSMAWAAPSIIFHPDDVKAINDRANKLTLSAEEYKKSARNNKTYYDNVTVYATNKDMVAPLVKEIQDMDLNAYSDSEWIDQARGATNILMAILAGIGSISLLVAAIGITNTMVMSIYERTKEIGVMKVIGASVKDIRNLFLLEAGFIGLLGGIMGVLASYGISYILNHVVASIIMSNMGGGGESPTLSVIPIELGLLALLFSFLIGVLTGYLPARRATKLSAIEAIRTE